ncbi:aminoglycoside phosphotransferase family protein [Hyphomicrobiaceae bacterium 22]|uniref:Aminoglycoside phosphotransferase family protein n=2 Tax=Prosthecodimorpha staleyi TaxID=2840188 RepID=A0A947D6J9_9HYPH|nr:aminoglycoside phosphotransferase family protein [Prosthecodimorpha staleyi]
MRMPFGGLCFLREKTCFVFVDATMHIYRVPATRRMIAEFESEYRIIDLVRPNLRVPIPQAELFGSDPPIARYRAIPGQPLSRMIDRLRSRRQTGWIDDLAQAILALHDTPVPDYARPAAFVGDRIRLRRLLAGKGATDMAAELEASSQIARAALEGADTAALCHGDLKGGNVLIDPATGRLAGLIDFGNAGFGARESDIAHTRLPEPEHDALVQRYEALSGRRLDRDRLAAFVRFERACHAATRFCGRGDG